MRTHQRTFGRSLSDVTLVARGERHVVYSGTGRLRRACSERTSAPMPMSMARNSSSGPANGTMPRAVTIIKPATKNRPRPATEQGSPERFSNHSPKPNPALATPSSARIGSVIRPAMPNGAVLMGLTAPGRAIPITETVSARSIWYRQN